MVSFKTTNLYTRVGVGTYLKAFIYEPYSTGFFFDVTPSGFTTGNQHGNADESEASRWMFDSWLYPQGNVINPQLIGVQSANTDGFLYWQASWASPTAAMVTVASSGGSGVPTDNSAVVVTPEQFVMLLGAGGSPNTVSWCDRGDIMTWTPTSTNQAGSYDIPGGGWLMNGKRGRGETLLWTDTSLYSARYTGDTETVYTIDPVGRQCGVFSRAAMTMVDGRAYWMGNGAFYCYDGFVRTIPCDVSNYVFGRLNRTQRSKVSAVASPETNTVIWFYPSGSSSTGENDSYVEHNYVEGWWGLGSINRSDGVERGAYDYPIYAGVSGALYKHENGTTYAEEDASTLTPYIESGPIELGVGDRTMMVRYYEPDENTLGYTNLTLLSAFHPTGTETTNGPYTAANPTGLRVTGRQIRAKFTQVTGGWRVGNPRLDVVPGPGR